MGRERGRAIVLVGASNSRPFLSDSWRRSRMRPIVRQADGIDLGGMILFKCSVCLVQAK
jgi:hypothetical protein